MRRSNHPQHHPNLSARACIEGNHLAGVLTGGSRPRINNPNYEVKEQFQPTVKQPLRRHHIHARSAKGPIK
jgi:hypothetical protein